MTFALQKLSLFWINWRSKKLICVIKVPNEKVSKQQILSSFIDLSLNGFHIVFRAASISSSTFISVFLSVSYGTQVYSFAANPKICRFCFFLWIDLWRVVCFRNRFLDWIVFLFISVFYSAYWADIFGSRMDLMFITMYVKTTRIFVLIIWLYDRIRGETYIRWRHFN